MNVKIAKINRILMNVKIAKTNRTQKFVDLL